MFPLTWERPLWRYSTLCDITEGYFPDFSVLQFLKSKDWKLSKKKKEKKSEHLIFRWQTWDSCYCLKTSVKSSWLNTGPFKIYSKNFYYTVIVLSAGSGLWPHNHLHDPRRRRWSGRFSKTSLRWLPGRSSAGTAKQSAQGCVRAWVCCHGGPALLKAPINSVSK